MFTFYSFNLRYNYKNLLKEVIMFKKMIVLLFSISFLNAVAMATTSQNALLSVLDEQRAGTEVEIKEDEDDVYDAVQKGEIKPFSALYQAVDQQLHGRLIKVELDEEDNDWVYELKLIHAGHVIEVDYDASTLEVLKIKGRDLINIIKK